MGEVGWGWWSHSGQVQLWPHYTAFSRSGFSRGAFLCHALTVSTVPSRAAGPRSTRGTMHSSSALKLFSTPYIMQA